MSARPVLVALLLVLAIARTAHAHEIRPAYLEIQETEPARFDVLWRTPVLAGMRLPVVLKLPDGVKDLDVPSVQTLSDSLVERRVIDPGPNGLDGKRIEFVGLPLTITDVLVRVALRDGTTFTAIARPSQPFVEIAAAGGAWSVLRSYWQHGMEHILFGYDHLLFVLALILIVPSARVLFFTITAFTLAHSLTLALATLGLVHVPGPPVEAAIAASILLLAS
jgi:HupE/UreJ protein